ncbi:TonB-dependent receptor domain-containing protein [Xylophilus sp.]|uniref:TonB-dependent receptor domain-containing protein n=1 Tax=Xylophilus sp. TaxID=2653893 RepID=UPI002D7FD6BA|nr:TonB-dependent receptor [Xylophilus sp.]
MDNTLLFNADIYLVNINNYIQAVQVHDAYTTNLNNNGQLYYTSTYGNVPKVQSKGLEIDGIYRGLPRTTLRFAGAYTDARYKSFPNSAQPAENGYTGASPYRDLSGRTLPGASKFTFNIGGDWFTPVWGDKVFHVSFNTAYNSKYNSDNTLSEYG